jgi:hypothetical protein
MSNAFKWMILKAGTVVARNVSSLFYQLLHREFYREIHNITKDGEKTTAIAAQLGYLAAKESAERQIAIFRLFPQSPEKILEYVPLLWELYNGVPMENYTAEWDRSDPVRPILNYIMNEDPLSFGIGTDPERDNLPWNHFWHNNSGYGSFISGLLTQVATFILKVKGANLGIIITNSENLLQGGKKMILKCQIVPLEEAPHYSSFAFAQGVGEETSYSKVPEGDEEEPELEIPNSDGVWAKITDKITIDQLEELFGTPTGYLKVTVRKLVEKYLHMTPYEAFDHFSNYEGHLFKIFGFLSVHVFNELGQIPQKLFGNEQFARVYGHLFLFLRQNANKFVSSMILGELRNYFAQIMEGIAPEHFVAAFRAIPDSQIMVLFFEGAQKALKDLGIPFTTLKSTLYEEFKAMQKSAPPESAQILEGPTYTQDRQDQKNLLIGQLMEEFLIISTAIISMPAQLLVILLYNAFSGINDIGSNVFNTIRDSSQKIMDAIEKMKD